MELEIFLGKEIGVREAELIERLENILREFETEKNRCIDDIRKKFYERGGLKETLKRIFLDYKGYIAAAIAELTYMFITHQYSGYSPTRSIIIALLANSIKEVVERVYESLLDSLSRIRRRKKLVGKNVEKTLVKLRKKCYNEIVEILDKINYDKLGKRELEIIFRVLEDIVIPHARTKSESEYKKYKKLLGYVNNKLRILKAFEEIFVKSYTPLRICLKNLSVPQ